MQTNWIQYFFLKNQLQRKKHHKKLKKWLPALFDNIIFSAIILVVTQLNNNPK